MFHVECSYDLNSFTDQGLIAVGREKEEDKCFFRAFQSIWRKSCWGSTRGIPHGTYKSTLMQFQGRQAECGVLGQIISSTRSRFTTLENEVECNCCRWSCASKLHLKSHLVKKRTHPIWESAKSETCNESDSQKQVECWARAGLWRSLYRCVEELEQVPNHRKQEKTWRWNIGRTVWNRLLEAACRHWRFQVSSWSSNSRSTGRGRTTGWELHEGNHRKNWEIKNGIERRVNKKRIIERRWWPHFQGNFTAHNVRNWLRGIVRIGRTTVTVQCQSFYKHVM